MRSFRVLPLLATLFILCKGQNLRLQCSRDQRETTIGLTNANVVLAGLFPIHKGKMNGCGDFDEDSMQLFEAARWSLDYINLRNLAGNGLKLGMKAWDNCYSAPRSIENVLDFYPEDMSEAKYCNASNSVITMGVLGPYTSWSSGEVAKLLSIYPASQISYGAANSGLSDKSIYPYFLRTAPSSGTSATNLLSLLRKLQWNHLVAIFTDDAYGTNSFDEFLRITRNTEICVSQAVLIDTADSVDQIKNKLTQIVQTKATVGLIFAPSERANAIMDALNKRGDAGHLQWVLNDLNIEKNNQNRYLKGALILTPKSVIINDFVDHWVRLNPNNPPAENPWYKEWYMTKYNCRLPGNVPAKFQGLNNCILEPESKRRSDFLQNAYVEPVVLAMFAFASAMRSAHLSKCLGQQGVCPALRSMSAQEFHNQYVMKVDYNVGPVQNRRVKFDANGDIENPEFRLWNYVYDSSIGKEILKQVGSSQNDIWTLQKITLYDKNRNFDISAQLTSRCPSSGCPTCLVYYQRPYLNYIDGSLLIGGLFSAHDPGRLPFTCGPLNLQNVQAMLAFRYAIENAKKQFPFLLKGVSLGAVYSDVCQSDTLIESTLSKFLGERQVFRDKATNKLIEPNLIQAYVSSLKNKQAKVAADLLGKFRYPQVESSATVIELSDKDKYPLFSRSTPGEGIQLLILAHILKRKGWTYAQVVSSNPGSVEALKTYAKDLSVCISAVHMYDSDNPDFQKVVEGLRMNPHAKAVVVTGSPSEVNALLGAMNNQKIAKEFVLLGTDRWGTSSASVAKQEQAADGSITLTTDTTLPSGFKQYLDKLDPKSDPLLTEWYQKLFDCYLYAGAQGSYSKKCGTDTFTTSSKFVMDKSVYYTINAVYVVASALNNTITHYCGANKGECAAFRASRYNTQSITLESIRDKTIMDANRTPFVMKNGQGMSSFSINVYQSNNGFQKVGMFDIFNNKLQLNPASTVYSQCPSICYECHQIPKNDYIFNRGQFIIASILGLHRPANPSSPLPCGDQIDYQFVAALQYAINAVNNGSAPVGLNGIRLGSLIMDSCKINTRAFGLMSAVYSGEYHVSDHFRQSEVVAWMTDTSGAASQMGVLASELGVPLISPSATSELLMNRKKYSTFYRTVAGDESLLHTILLMCKTMNFRYIQTISSMDSFSLESASTLKEMGKNEGVCVVSSLRLGNESYTSAILDQARLNGVPVVLFVSPRELEALLKAKRVPQDDDIVFITPQLMAGVAQKYPNAAKNLLTSKSGAATNLKPYLSYLSTVRPDDTSYSNGLFEEFYQNIYLCNLPGRSKYSANCPMPFQAVTSSSRFSASPSVSPTINGVYAVVDALHTTLEKLCGVNYTSICPAFYASKQQPALFFKNLDAAKVAGSSGNPDFRFVNREGMASYDILRFTGSIYEKVGSYDGMALKMDDISRFYQGSRNVGNFQNKYLNCFDQKLNFTLIPGDIYLAGLFDVHKQGLRLFSCGDIQMLRGYQNLEAFQFAIQRVNDKTGQFEHILPGVKLGGVGLDSCSSDVRAGNLVSNINNRLIKLTKRGVTVDPSDIYAYIGGATSDSSIYLNRILRTLKVPQISYAATSVQLNDRNRYPYFLRTVPADDILVKAMTELLSLYNIRYVQVVHTADNYGMKGAEVFNKVAEKTRICVAQTIQFAQKGISLSDSANNVVSVLLEKPLANTVIVFAQPMYINELLKAVSREPLAKQRKYKFVGASQWGKTWDAVRHVESIAEGSISMAVQYRDIFEFNTYLNSQRLSNQAANPWFGEYYEKIFNCYLTERKGDLYKPCRSTSESIVSPKSYVQDDSVLNVINSVFATAYGLHSVLKQVCGSNYTGVCPGFYRETDKVKLLLGDITNAKFTDLSEAEFEFNSMGSSNKGYIFYQLQRAQPTGYRYQEIATANSSGTLFPQIPINNWQADCNRLGACTECALLRNLHPRFMVHPVVKPPEVKPVIVGIFDIHSKGQNAFQCGKLNIQGDFINMLAFFYALELAGSATPVVGAALDTCGHSLQADQDAYSILSSGSLCRNPNFAKELVAKSGNVYSFLTMHNANTIAANRVLNSQKVAYLSPDATGSRFLTDDSFGYLYRSTDTQLNRIQALIHLLKKKDIQNTVVFHSNGPDHSLQLKTFLEKTKEQKLCVERSVSAQNPVAVSKTLQQISPRIGLKVMVFLTNQSDAEIVLESLKATSASSDRDFVLLGIEDWMLSLAAKFESLVRVVITATPKYGVVPGFVDYVKTLGDSNRRGIPQGWFDEFYQTVHKCRLPGNTHPANLKVCTQAENITDGMLELSNPVILKTILGTISLVDAVQKMGDQCRSVPTSVECRLETPNGREKFQKILAGTNFKINEKLETQPKLEFFNFTERVWKPEYVLQELRSTNGGYEFQDINPNSNFKSINNQVVETALVTCEKCGCANDVKISFSNQMSGTALNSISWTDMGQSNANIRNYFYYQDGKQLYIWPLWAIIVAAVTAVGIMFTLILFFYLLFAYPIRGGTTPIGFIFMVGVLGIYGVNFAFFVPASMASCAARRFCMGVVYAICFACLLVKAVDNWRSSDSVYDKTKYKRLTSRLSLTIITIGIVLMQVVIPVEWLLLVPPSSVNRIPTSPVVQMHDYSWCTPIDHYDSGLALSFLFVIILDLVTILFGSLAWDQEKNCFESRWIVIACLCTSGCFLVWMVVSTVADPVYRDPAVAIGNFVNATVLVFIVPLRKVLLLMDAKKNEELDQSMANIDDIYNRPSSYIEPQFVEKSNW